MRKLLILPILFLGLVILSSSAALAAAPVISTATSDCSAGGQAQVTVNWSGGSGSSQAIEIKEGANAPVATAPLWWQYISATSPAIAINGDAGQTGAAGELPNLVLAANTTYTVWIYKGAYSASKNFTTPVSCAPTYNFSLSNSGPVSVASGSSINQIINLSGSGTLPSNVTLTVSGLPAGVTASFSPASVDLNSGSGNSVMVINVGAAASFNSVVTVTGTVGSMVRTTVFNLIINSPQQSDHTGDWFPDPPTPWTLAVPPDLSDNRPAPLNMSPKAQVKEGWLGLRLANPQTSVPVFPLHVLGESMIYGDLFVGSPTNPQTIYVNGDLGYSGSVTDTQPSSDSKLKKDVLPLGKMLGNILKLKPVSFNWKDRPSDLGTKLGLIAQDVEEIIPEAVSDLGEVKSINYAAVVTSMIKAIQEKQVEIDLLREEINKLKTLE